MLATLIYCYLGRGAWTRKGGHRETDKDAQTPRGKEREGYRHAGNGREIKTEGQMQRDREGRRERRREGETDRQTSRQIEKEKDEGIPQLRVGEGLVFIVRALSEVEGLRRAAGRV